MKLKRSVKLVLLTFYFVSGCERSGITGKNELIEDVNKVKLVPLAVQIEGKPTGGYACRISTLADKEADYNYWNQTFWVQFPKNLVNETDKPVFKTFSFSSKYAGEKAGGWAGKSNIVRVAQCTIPDNEVAEELLFKRLKTFGKDTWLEDAKDKKLSSDQLSEWVCNGTLYTITICATYDPSTGTYSDCEESEPMCTGTWVYESDSDDGGGGGGDGNPSDDPGDCDPTGTVPCYNDDDGGSSEPPHPDPCDEEDPPTYCTNPCETGTILDDNSVQMALEDLWEEQLNTNVEEAGFLYENSTGEYALNMLADPLIKKQEVDKIEFYIPSNIPAGTIFIHTHPTQQAFNRFGISRVYDHKPSAYDYNVISQMNNVTKGYIIDPVKIIEYTSNQILNIFDRCGY